MIGCGVEGSKMRYMGREKVKDCRKRCGGGQGASRGGGRNWYACYIGMLVRAQYCLMDEGDDECR